MEKTGKRVSGLIFGLIVALMLLGTVAQFRVSAQTEYVPKVHPGGPGSHKQPLKQRILWRVKPFHIIGSISYVGMNSYNTYLIATPKGHFLLNAAVPQEVRASVEELGYKVTDIKYLLEGHPHNSDVYGLAQMKEWSGAKLLAMPGDVRALEEGGTSENYLPDLLGPVFAPVKVDRVIHDGEKIELGGVTMEAHLTAGDTAGCTSWTTEVEEKGKKYTVMLRGECSTLNQPLLGNENHPHIAEEYSAQFKTLHSLQVDVPLGIGASPAQMYEKAELMAKNPDMTNPFINPQAWNDFLAKNQKTFEDQLAKEKAGGGAHVSTAGETSSRPCPQDGRMCYNVYQIIMDCCAKIGAKYVGKD